MPARVVAVALAILCGAVASMPARAEPIGDAALLWQAPDSCPDAAEVRARIARRLGAPVDRVVHGVAVEVAVERDGRELRYVARIDLRGLRAAGRPASDSTEAAESGAGGANRAGDAGGATRSDTAGAGPAPRAPDAEVRVLTSAHCDELTDAVAVVIARITAEAAAPTGTSAGELRAERPAASVATPVGRPSWGAGLRVVALSGIGAMPGVSVGGELAGYVRARWLLAELAGMTWLHSVSFLRAGAPARIDVSLALAALRIGWGPEQLPLRAWLAAELGALRGEGVALDDPRVGTSPWVAVGTGFAVAWPMFEHARLVGAIEILAPLSRARFVLQDGSEVYRPGPVAVRSGLGLEVGWR